MSRDITKSIDRLPTHIQGGIYLALLCVIVLSLLPNYARIVYSDTESVSYSRTTDKAGYPVGTGFTFVESVDDMKGLDNFAISISVDNLQPTGLYRTVSNSKILNRWQRILRYLCAADVGQYYVADLDSGERIIIFIDDTAVSLPNSGEVVLPVARNLSANLESIKAAFAQIQSEYGLADENITWFVDTTGDWREDADDEIEDKRFYFQIISFIVLAVFFSRLFKRAEHANGSQPVRPKSPQNIYVIIPLIFVALITIKLLIGSASLYILSYYAPNSSVLDGVAQSTDSWKYVLACAAELAVLVFAIGYGIRVIMRWHREHSGSTVYDRTESATQSKESSFHGDPFNLPTSEQRSRFSNVTTTQTYDAEAWAAYYQNMETEHASPLLWLLLIPAQLLLDVFLVYAGYTFDLVYIWRKYTLQPELLEEMAGHPAPFIVIFFIIIAILITIVVVIASIVHVVASYVSRKQDSQGI